MRYELFIALRYLFSKQTAAEPSLIAMITTVGIALAVATLIGVLAVVGGFEGDLRDKMLSTRAHILVTGESHGMVEHPDQAVELIESHQEVEAVSPFIESELMISSPTKYSIVLYRGVEEENIRRVSSLEEDMVEGEIDWLDKSSEALRARFEARFGEQAQPSNPEDPTMGDLQQLQSDIDAMRAQIERLRDEEGGDTPVDSENAAEDREPVVNEPANDEAEEPSEDLLMPPLPPPRGRPDDEIAGADDARDAGVLMPDLPPARGDGDSASQEPLGGSRPAQRADRLPPGRELPGIIIGQGLQTSLRVLLGDTVNVVNPEGDLGPQGPIPRSRPHRVVGVFFSGLLEYDEAVGIVQTETAREILNLNDGTVTAIEVRIRDLYEADAVAAELQQRLEAAGLTSLEVRSWKELNRSLFSALALEKAAIAFGIGTIFIVSFLLILLVLWMFVTDKAREIAVLKSIGATRGGIARIFIIKGTLMGLFGALVGLAIGMGFVLYAVNIGIPLPAEVYYIDRVPIEVQPLEVALVLGVAIVTSVAGAVIPALQAAALDPVEGLRRE